MKMYYDETFEPFAKSVKKKQVTTSVQLEERNTMTAFYKAMPNECRNRLLLVIFNVCY